MPAKNNAVWKTQNVWNSTRETLSKRDTLIVFDLETTGLSRVNDRIIPIAAIRYGIDKNMNLKEQCIYHQYVNPGTPISDEITKLTGITGIGINTIDMAWLESEAYCITGISRRWPAIR